MKNYLVIVLVLVSIKLNAAHILLPMDNTQKNHLKSYGMTFFVLSTGATAEWLLNYKGGSFVFIYTELFEKECKLKGVSYDIIADVQLQKIKVDISNPEINQEVVKLETAPKIAVYSPKTKQPWDDAVTMVLTYAEIPYDVIYDDDVLQNNLHLYDWLHLHHEDFTGQAGKFWHSHQNQNWFKEEQRENTEIAKRWGYTKISELKLAVAKKIRDYVVGGGYLFAMCAAADTYDISLAAEGVDICSKPFDGDPMDADVDKKLNFNKTFAFKNFTLIKDPKTYEFSSIDATITRTRNVVEQQDYFTLFKFSAKWDVVPTMLTQNHTKIVKGFYGQTTAFRKQFLKSDVLVLGESKKLNEVRYIHGEFGKGMWTFYGGHDPEDYQHMVGEPPTDLNLFPNSPGYRLILNNVLFPAAKKKKRKT